MRRALLLLLVAAPLAAQEPAPVQGRWAATWARAVRDDGATVVVQRTADAVLELAGSDHALEGTWTTSVDEPETWHVTGSIDDGDVRLRADATRDGTFPGDGTARLVALEWTGRRTADGSLEGSMWLTLDTPRGRLRSAPRPWSARRIDPGR